MGNLLLVTRTGQEIEKGSKLHATSGAVAGTVWRYEHIAERPDGAHHVHVSRCGGKLGRVHRELHPSVFGLEIKIHITFVKHTANVVRHVRSKIDDYLMAGAFALVPLALYEHFHWGETITAALGFVGK